MSGKNSKIRALLYDFGGTLGFLDFELLSSELSRPHRRLDALSIEHAEYAGRAAMDRYLMSERNPDMQKGWEGFFRAWMNAMHITDEDEIRAIGERFRELHREATMWRVIREGTHDALERLKSAGYKLAIVSNADGRVEADCRRLGIAEFFDAIIDSQVVGVEKPNPRIFHIALERLGVAPETALYAGDIYSIDMLGAKAAGIAGKLIDQHDRYHWVDHAKIRHVGELHRHK